MASIQKYRFMAIKLGETNIIKIMILIAFFSIADFNFISHASIFFFLKKMYEFSSKNKLEFSVEHSSNSYLFLLNQLFSAFRAF